VTRLPGPLWLPVTLGFFTLLFASGAPTPLYPLYGDAFGLGAGGITVIFVGYVIGVMVTLLVVGHASDHVGRRPLLLAGLGWALLGGVLFLVATGPEWLFAARVCIGIANGFFFGAGIAAVVELHHSHSRQFAAVAAQASFSAGAAIGPAVGGLLAQWAPFPLRTTWVVYLLLVGAAFAGVLTLENDRRGTIRRALRPQPVGVPADIRLLFAGVAAGAFAVSAAGGLFSALAPTVLEELLDVRGAALAGLLMTGQQGVGFLSAVASRGVRPHRAATFGILAAAGGMTGATAAAGLDLPLLFLVAALLVGAGIGSGMVGTLGALNEAAPEARRAEVVSAYYVATYFGLGAPVVAADAFGLLAALVVFSAGLLALAGASVAAILRERRRLAHGTPGYVATTDVVALPVEPE
jgi:MFS family permease